MTKTTTIFRHNVPNSLLAVFHVSFCAYVFPYKLATSSGEQYICRSNHAFVCHAAHTHHQKWHKSKRKTVILGNTHSKIILKKKTQENKLHEIKTRIVSQKDLSILVSELATPSKRIRIFAGEGKRQWFIKITIQMLIIALNTFSSKNK